MPDNPDWGTLSGFANNFSTHGNELSHPQADRREGIEDYEYLWLLKSLGDSDFADRAVQGMVVDVSAFSRNVEELFELRQSMAARIESLKR